MQAISDLLNSKLSQCFPFIDNFFGFATDLKYMTKKDTKNFLIPFGCNDNPDQCNESEIRYLLPESKKQGIVFYDDLKILGKNDDIECENTIYQYQFDIVVWINTDRVVFTNTEFCSNTELMYNHFLNCLFGINADELNILSIGLWGQYMRSPWKFDDCQKYLNNPYIAFRIPMIVQFLVCNQDLEPLDYEIKDC